MKLKVKFNNKFQRNLLLETHAIQQLSLKFILVKRLIAQVNKVTREDKLQTN